MIHVGLDLHHRNSYVKALTEEGDVIEGRRIYHHNMEAFWDYLGQFGSERKRVVFEATANARWLERLLRKDPTVEPVAVTPHKVRIIAETVAKTDKIDAEVLASLSKMDALPRSWLPDTEVEDLRELTRHRLVLVRLRTRSKNRVNGVLVRRGIVRPWGNIFGKLGRQWLTEVELDAVMRLEADQWLSLLDDYDRKIDVIERKLYHDYARRDRWRGDVALLMTMPGWGKLTALTILAELGDYRRFTRRSSVSNFAGLVPSSKRSDKSCRYGKITKRGSTALRNILVEVSINAVRKVPRYGKLYTRLKAAKSGNVGKVAVARQMLEDGWTMLMKQEPFRFVPNQAESRTRRG
jgi:transposase